MKAFNSVNQFVRVTCTYHITWSQTVTRLTRVRFQAGNYFRRPKTGLFGLAFGFLFAALAALTASFFTTSISLVSCAFCFALESASLMYSIASFPVKWKLGTFFEAFLVVSFFLPFEGRGKTFLARALRIIENLLNLYITLLKYHLSTEPAPWNQTSTKQTSKSNNSTPGHLYLGSSSLYHTWSSMCPLSGATAQFQSHHQDLQGKKCHLKNCRSQVGSQAGKRYEPLSVDLMTNGAT